MVLHGIENSLRGSFARILGRRWLAKRQFIFEVILPRCFPPFVETKNRIMYSWYTLRCEHFFFFFFFYEDGKLEGKFSARSMARYRIFKHASLERTLLFGNRFIYRREKIDPPTTCFYRENYYKRSRLLHFLFLAKIERTKGLSETKQINYWS